jgi:hypothetical protein
MASVQFDPFKVDPFQETLTQLAARLALDAELPVEVIRSGTKGIGKRGAAKRDTLAVRIIELREQFCYEAYATGRYSLAQLGRFCKLGRSARCQVHRRVHSYAKRKGLRVPHIKDNRRQNLASRKVDFVDVADVAYY